MKTVSGNILDCEEGIIVHQVNFAGVMGAGLALQVKRKYPIVFSRYIESCNSLTWESVLSGGAVDFVKVNPKLYVANLFAQRHYGTDRTHTNYEYFRTGMKTLARFSIREKLPVAIPYKIGCGLAGGDWQLVSDIIQNELENIDYTIYRLED